ncbi:MAG: hypothetical protein U5K43_03100 [Halofilum sp. (in: g-proteobacteria)]|nr:hypothetical protein [Halofilum sp. (in: g-proteobacteria)]
MQQNHLYETFETMPMHPTFDLFELEYRLVRARNRLNFRLRSKDDRDAWKVFVVGHPRTGTGTLDRIFRENGLASLHTSGTWRTADYDCFADRGNYQPLDLLAQYYRNGFFILNTRPSMNYLRSRAINTIKKRKRDNLPQPRFTVRNGMNEIIRRNNHFLDFVTRFHGSSSFCIINIERPGAFEFAARTLGLEPVPDAWSHRGQSDVDTDLLERIRIAYRELGIENDRDNPFIIRDLLEPQEIDRVDRFLDEHSDRVFL